ncbi:hypothetical protein [Aliiroseovarius sp. PrR006]|uniref:hypothetical protein n=1 Tax=Aliiroseovarius sp. PrR006 TaxID=2706883 RepID=UPI0013D6876C|nr:hypothetical protein [Aliiroseovarius sp. PrR006]NDW53653.1 hypothetical protein [Aliiroseovarius sp. PrR006]
MALRCEKRRKDAPNSFPLDHLFSLLEKREEDETQKKLLGAEDEKMLWCSDVKRTNSTIRFLLHFGDKDVSNPSFVDFDTTDTREVEKEENEGIPYSSHIVIRSDPEANGHHMILIERASGIHIKAVEAYLRWLLKDENFKIEYENEHKQAQSVFGIVEIFGYKSKLLKDVLRTGTIQDVEFVKEEKVFLNGSDEDGEEAESFLSAKFRLQKKVSEEQGRTWFEHLTGWSRNHGYDENAKMLVRIKTAFGQIKQTEVDPNGDILGSFFVANEQVSGFEEPLPQFYQSPRPDMFEKIEGLFGQYKLPQ